VSELSGLARLGPEDVVLLFCDGSTWGSIGAIGPRADLGVRIPSELLDVLPSQVEQADSGLDPARLSSRDVDLGRLFRSILENSGASCQTASCVGAKISFSEHSFGGDGGNHF